MRVRADLTLLMVSILWGSAFVAQRVAGQLGSVYLFNAARYLLAALVVFPVAWRAQHAAVANSLPRITRQQYLWMLVAGFLLFLGSALQQAGLVYTSAGNAGFISGLYVVFIPLALLLFWREKQHWLSVIAVILASIGAFFLSTAGRFEVNSGDALEVGGALFWTFHVIVLGKFASRFESVSFSVGQLVVCGLLNLAVGVSAESFPLFSYPLMAAIAYTAFLSLGLSYTLQIWAQQHTPPADAALILSLESVFAVISGWLVLNERLSGIQLFGCVLIFLAVILSQFKKWNSGTINHDQLFEGR